MSHHTLNPEQKRAVLTTSGRVLILAGAGSGKTRVLTTRMAYLINEQFVPASSILGLTFTNKAAQEMRHRIGKLVAQKAAKEICLCTFHSFCMMILRAEIHHLGFTKDFSLYDARDVERLASMIARDELEQERELPSLSQAMGAIGNARSKGLKSHEITGTGSTWHDQFTQTLFKRLGDSLRAYNAVDFDSLLTLTVELFEKHPEILDKYQERFRYIMIDEYQDTNPIQYRLAHLLSSKYHNLCVVGDDDQSIYGWRGAEVKNILAFDQATVIKLEQNYRSTNAILKAANAVISNNKERHQKHLWSTNGEGEPILTFVAPNEVDEAQSFAARIAKLKVEKNLKWSDIAILYRSNALSRQFEVALLKQNWICGERWVMGIPYQVHGGLEFYERREVKDLAAYLRVLLNPKDQEALLRIINQPRRGIGEASLDALTAYNRKHKLPLWEVLVQASQGHSELSAHLTPRSQKGLSQFLDIMEQAKIRFESGALTDSLKWLIDTIQFQKAIMEEVKSDKMQQFKWENVQEFVSALSEYEQKEGEKSLRDFVSTITLDDSFQHAAKNNNDDRVNLLTFHSAKGLEFKACFLVGVEDHIIPHEKSMKETGIEEERRLMYVAITRAMQHLTISMAKQRKRMGQDSSSKPSRFLFEIPKELIKPVSYGDL